MANYMNIVFNTVYRKIQFSLCSLIRKNRRGFIDHYGTGFFYKIDNFLFLVTATHNLDSFKEYNEDIIISFVKKEKDKIQKK